MMAGAQALLVLDLQVGAFEGRWAMPDGDVLIQACQQAVAWARVARAMVIWVQHHEPGGALSGPGFAIDARLNPQADEARLLKAEPDAFTNPALAPLLAGMDRVLVAGLQSELCVRATVRGGRAAGFPVVLIADAHHTWPTPQRAAGQVRDAVNAELGRDGVPLETLAGLRLPFAHALR